MKLSITDILFMVFIGPIPPGMLKVPNTPEEPDKELEVPDAKANQTIGILFGKRPIKNPILGWHGDLEIKKVKVDAGTKK